MSYLLYGPSTVSTVITQHVPVSDYFCQEPKSKTITIKDTDFNKAEQALELAGIKILDHGKD